jgi:hypothetical protein
VQQSEAGLLGEIDWESTHDGVITCKDGFSAHTVNAEQFLGLVTGLNVDLNLTEIDNSSLFCAISRKD